MDLFWSWFYEQLEQQPEEEAELLRNAAEQAMEAPPGMEPQASARLLQSRIGNQAMQRLIEMKTLQQSGREQQKETEKTPEQVPAPEEVDAATAVTEEEQVPELNEVVVELTPEPQAEEQKKSDLSATREAENEPTAEEKLALALRRFSSTLQAGGGAKEWSVLNLLFKAASNPVQQQVLQALSEWVLALSQSPQQLFMQHLLLWRRNSGSDDLAALLYLRLRSLTPNAKTQGQVENNGNNNE